MSAAKIANPASLKNAIGRLAPSRGRLANLKGRILAIAAVVTATNIGAWIWAAAAFQHRPLLLGVALVIYGLGLRHAVDADHIAAIDNVTRKLMHENKRPVSVGFYFAMGHSSLVIFVTATVAAMSTAFGRFQAFKTLGGVVSTVVSATFLLAIAAMNIVIFWSIYRTYRKVLTGGAYVEEDLDMLLNNRGLLSRVLRPLFRLVTSGWHMFPLGFLFGFGFDTATEIALFGVSAAQAAKGIPFGAILVFPVLFAAGMSLVDTADGVMMLGAYNWAFIKPMRKLHYNLTITLISIAVAVLIGGIEALGLLGQEFACKGGFWKIIGALNGDMNTLGFLVLGLFVVSWVASYVVYKSKKLDAFEVRQASSGRP